MPRFGNRRSPLLRQGVGRRRCALRYCLTISAPTKSETTTQAISRAPHDNLEAGGLVDLLARDTGREAEVEAVERLHDRKAGEPGEHLAGSSPARVTPSMAIWMILEDR